MANLTLAIDDEKLALLRIYAAEKRTSVNAIFRKHADELLGDGERRKAARAWMQAKVRENIARDEEHAAARARGEVVDEETWRWSREETYAERQWPKGG